MIRSCATLRRAATTTRSIASRPSTPRLLGRRCRGRSRRLSREVKLCCARTKQRCSRNWSLKFIIKSKSTRGLSTASSIRCLSCCSATFASCSFAASFSLALRRLASARLMSSTLERRSCSVRRCRSSSSSAFRSQERGGSGIFYVDGDRRVITAPGMGEAATLSFPSPFVWHPQARAGERVRADVGNPKHANNHTAPQDESNVPALKDSTVSTSPPPRDRASRSSGAVARHQVREGFQRNS